MQRRVAILVFDGFQILDATGPAEVLARAGRVAGGPYRVEFVAPHDRPVRTGSGLAIVPDREAQGVRGPLDTLLVAGGGGVRKACEDERLVAWLRRAASR